ncbi:helix-turn-helix transcriptional regulator [Chitinophaga agrisoli]|uniref:Helix-turn-helix transcriptional regulator n=1 Tax=Chitinophaga agrisoli TaxID=2607653 RepID=A0A5B2VZK0_9BACT|nr:AraC family transcriptional regulator [Chitinophaga agrisoli]KAA2243469.1 helix-turn-helix transcriptional regulator [Chitinophaga agrisoli]
MGTILSSTGEHLVGLKQAAGLELGTPVQYPVYTVLFIPAGEGKFHADFGTFPFSGPTMLFSTPFQTLQLASSSPQAPVMLQFHGDFYCIAYHHNEVSCNGLLFNNVYISPMIGLNNEDVRSIELILSQFEEELRQPSPSETVLQAYLQLLLAKSSSIKLRAMADGCGQAGKDEQMERFRELLDENYLTLHKPNDYADLLAMSPNTFTKRCTRYFKKPPSRLIQERLILEAKKQLHLTRRSIKEIAYALNFEDEFYFSRMFKKFTNVSPQAFRDRTGISIVADLTPQ